MFPRVDEFMSTKVFFPIGGFLNRLTGFSTQSIAFWLVFMSLGFDILINVEFGSSLLGWIMSYLSLPIMWVCWIRCWRHLDEHPTGTLLPTAYYMAVNLRQAFNLLITISFFLFLLPPYNIHSCWQLGSNFTFILGVNMFTMMWPKRTNWATAKYRQLKGHFAKPKKELVLI